MNLRIFLALLLILICSGQASAQKGVYLTAWGGPQLVSIDNFDDYLRGDTARDPVWLDKPGTYRYAFGVGLVYNFHDFYGLRTGIYYSQAGQKYEGHIQNDHNRRDPSHPQGVDFTSHIYLNYYRIPLVFCFNSQMDPDDRVNMTLGAGVQLGILNNVQEVVTSPAPPDSLVNKFPGFNFKKLYKPTDFGLTALAQVNVKITSFFGTFIGARFDKSISSIENLNYKLPNDAPAEWFFPVSTKKSVLTDNLTRRPTKNSAVNIYLGLSFSLSKEKKPNP